MDRTHIIQALHLGEVNRVDSTRAFAGGKGLDVARTVRRLGIPVAAYGFLGGEIGDAVRSACRAAGVEDRHTQISDDTRVCNIYLEQETKRVTVVNEQGPFVTEQEQASLVQQLLSDVEDGDFVVFSGSVPTGVPDDFYARMIRRLATKRVYTIVDAGGNLLKEAIAARPWMIKPNIHEFKQVYPNVTDELHLPAVMKDIVASGISHVVVTLGEKGCVAASADRLFYVRVPSVEVVNPIASGDTFIGGFLAKYVEAGDFERSVRFASACAMANAMNAMPELPQNYDLDDLTESTRVEAAG
jgi:1-phosphofructokinase family hexose kinase